MPAMQSEAPPRQTVGAGIVVAVVALLGVAAVALGLVYAAQSAVGVYRAQTVPVRMAGEATWTEPGVIPEVEGYEDPTGAISSGHGLSPSEWVGGTPFPVRNTGSLVMEVFEADALTSLEADAPWWAGLVGAGAILLTLVPVVRSYAAAEPFAPGTARRLGIAAAIALVAWVCASVLPFHAASAVLADHLYSGPPVPDGWVAPHLRAAWWPGLIVLLLAGLAVASRRGERLAAETDGLV
ncbi:hypothetical protein [Actinotalea subterranea]|uniref:hypothetical protein n=1 Tax=Actinotalea subterranea TaxID=2607497 RepID=UPI0011EBDD34|nr:hypothetical protein [Actinotalea subterranea]